MPRGAGGSVALELVAVLVIAAAAGVVEVATGLGVLLTLFAFVGLEVLAARRWRSLVAVLERIESAVTDLDELEAAHELELEAELDGLDPPPAE